MKTFLIAAKYENFRQASEELYLTQPAVTKHISKLEENLNTKLFDRIGKGVVLTEAGQHFRSTAQTIVAKYDEGLGEFERWQQGFKKKLVIAVAPQIASSVLPAFLQEFTFKNPSIELLINVLKSFEISEEIRSGKANLGLTRLKPSHLDLSCRIIHEEEVVLIAPPRFDQTYSECQLFEDYRLITHNHPEYWDPLLGDVKHHYPKIQTMKVNQIEITKRFIEQGLGVSYLPLTMVKEELGRQTLVNIPNDKITPPQSLTYILTKTITKEAQQFIDFFQAKMATLV
ncbi:LysR family transcriptional regulator [Vagococcus sp. BWB3-3]|uniref:LysR family transcriptional regulator n=1 Tax=Vagococcus allomyrinae TaxID=2794353 RepID=A0A940PA43_9ENTE|nr:LysR family transcriptional regulator [Vagococcus allomyrinae]MBP1040772.1 LysR family transcriptional regulator [Vagococcus allomyrinae]